MEAAISPGLIDGRETTLERLARHRFDVLVVGGGITGAAIAHRAALGNLSVALVDKADFASGTSSRSSRLIHGVLGCLKHGLLRLVMRMPRDLRRMTAAAPYICTMLT